MRVKAVLNDGEAAPWRKREFTPTKLYRFVQEHELRKEIDGPKLQRFVGQMADSLL